MSELKDKIVEILEDHIGSKLTIVENKNDYDDISSEPTGIEEAAQEIVDQLGLGWKRAADELPPEDKNVYCCDIYDNYFIGHKETWDAANDPVILDEEYRERRLKKWHELPQD